MNQAAEVLTRLEQWLRSPGERELTDRDRHLLEPMLRELGDQTERVAELALGSVALREARRS